MSITKTKQSYSKVKRDHAGKDQYYSTPVSLALAQLTAIRHKVTTKTPRILDVGAGNLGPYGYAARTLWPDASIIGIEIRDVPKFSWYDAYRIKSIFDYDVEPESIDLVIGNPPFNQAEKIIRHVLENKWIDWYGTLTLFLRNNFAASIKRATGLFDHMPPSDIIYSAKRPTWWLYETSNAGKTSTTNVDYAVFNWPAHSWMITTANWLVWDYQMDYELQFVGDLAQEGHILQAEVYENLERMKEMHDRRKNGHK